MKFVCKSDPKMHQIVIYTLVSPQWWSFIDVSQQGLHFSKKISKIFFWGDLAFTDVHTGHQKVPKSDFQSRFSMSKSICICLKKFQ